MLVAGAQNGGTPHLAVAHEEGTVHVFDTSKRRDWDEGKLRSFSNSAHAVTCFALRTSAPDLHQSLERHIRHQVGQRRLSDSDLLR